MTGPGGAIHFIGQSTIALGLSEGFGWGVLGGALAELAAWFKASANRPIGAAGLSARPLLLDNHSFDDSRGRRAGGGIYQIWLGKYQPIAGGEHRRNCSVDHSDAYLQCAADSDQGRLIEDKKCD